jgi:hypothetical protein
MECHLDEVSRLNVQHEQNGRGLMPPPFEFHCGQHLTKFTSLLGRGIGASTGNEGIRCDALNLLNDPFGNGICI